MSKSPRPTASLSDIAVVRRPSLVLQPAPAAVPASTPVAVPAPAPAPSDKSGDITDDLAASVPPANLPEPPPPAARPIEPARAEEIVVYWERLRRGRPFPPLADVDRAMVGSSWPDSLIVAFEGGDMAMPRISRLGPTDGAIEYTPMVTDWILTRARHAARRATKLDEVQSFPIEGDTPRYRLLLLPLGASNGASDCVLCHLCRAA